PTGPIAYAAGSCIAYADGSCKVEIHPHLELFGSEYQGGLAVVTPCQSFPTQDDLDKYFSAEPHTFRVVPPVGGISTDQAANKKRQWLDLRCRFHLKDDALKKLGNHGVKVAFQVRPTGEGFFPEPVPDKFYEVLRMHYLSCERNLAASPWPSSPATIFLEPSK